MHVHPKGRPWAPSHPDSGCSRNRSLHLQSPGSSRKSSPRPPSWKPCIAILFSPRAPSRRLLQKWRVVRRPSRLTWDRASLPGRPLVASKRETAPMRSRLNVPGAPVVGCRTLPIRPTSRRIGSIVRCRWSPGLACRRNPRARAATVLAVFISSCKHRIHTSSGEGCSCGHSVVC